MLDIKSLNNKQIFLVESPKDKLKEENFELKISKVPKPKNEEILIETRYISIDAKQSMDARTNIQRSSFTRRCDGRLWFR